jgi:lipoate-protein ligase A
MNMAIDEALSESVAIGADPTIRFYKWKPSAVSLGYFQSMDDVVDKESCIRQKVDIVRRRTGGGAVFHWEDGEITYSVIAPLGMFPKNIIESYREICGYVIKGLKNLDIDAQFAPINDILVDGKKISGNAQTRRNSVLLQHGTVLHDVDVHKMFSLLKVPDEKIKDKMIQSVMERVTSIQSFKKIAQEDTYKALLKGFCEEKEYEFQELTEKELDRAIELAGSRYCSDKWNFMR